MPSWILTTIIACLALLSAISIFDSVKRRTIRPTLWALLASAAVIALLALTAGLRPVTLQSFGNDSEQLMVAGMMFVAVIFGILGTYLFNLGGAFSWRDFLRPVVVSPLILLPLLGSLQGAEMKPIQIVCFVVLAFQNGFFWQQVLKDARPTAGGPVPIPQPSPAPMRRN